MKEFKVGDKVYYPLKSNKVLTLLENKSTFDYPLLAKEFSFTSDGKYSGGDTSPSLFHATPENHALLEQLYGVEFEKPPIKPTSHEIIKALLGKGYGNIPCWVSDDCEQPTHKDKWVFISYCSDTPYSKDVPYIDSIGYDWVYATPFDPTTGEPITELPK